MNQWRQHAIDYAARCRREGAPATLGRGGIFWLGWVASERKKGARYWLPDGKPDERKNRLYGARAEAAARAAGGKSGLTGGGSGRRSVHARGNSRRAAPVKERTMGGSKVVSGRDYARLLGGLSDAFAALRSSADPHERAGHAEAVRRYATELMRVRPARRGSAWLDAQADAERLIDRTASYLAEHGLTAKAARVEAWRVSLADWMKRSAPYVGAHGQRVVCPDGTDRPVPEGEDWRAVAADAHRSDVEYAADPAEWRRMPEVDPSVMADYPDLFPV